MKQKLPVPDFDNTGPSF